MLPSELRMAQLEDVINVIFAELDPVWLKSMWDEDGETGIAWSRSTTCSILLRLGLDFFDVFMTISIKL
jgi:hypothetical protein